MDIKSAKANTIKAKLDRHGHNPKKFWQEINNLLPHSHESHIRSMFDEDTNRVRENMDLNDYVNEFLQT